MKRAILLLLTTCVGCSRTFYRQQADADAYCLENHKAAVVGTDPDHLSRGHGARLMAAMVELIRSSGSIPFLHVREGNLRAIALYERGGFVTRRRIDYLVVAATVD